MKINLPWPKSGAIVAGDAANGPSEDASDHSGSRAHHPVCTFWSVALCICAPRREIIPSNAVIQCFRACSLVGAPVHPDWLRPTAYQSPSAPERPREKKCPMDNGRTSSAERHDRRFAQRDKPLAQGIRLSVYQSLSITQEAGMHLGSRPSEKATIAVSELGPGRPCFVLGGCCWLQSEPRASQACASLGSRCGEDSRETPKDVRSHPTTTGKGI